MSYLTLHLRVRSDVDWPLELCRGDDVLYNTDVLQTGLATRESVEGKLQRLRIELDGKLREVMEQKTSLECRLHDLLEQRRTEVSAASDRAREEGKRISSALVGELRSQLKASESRYANEMALRMDTEKRLSIELCSARAEVVISTSRALEEGKRVSSGLIDELRSQAQLHEARYLSEVAIRVDVENRLGAELRCARAEAALAVKEDKRQTAVLIEELRRQYSQEVAARKEIESTHRVLQARSANEYERGLRDGKADARVVDTGKQGQLIVNDYLKHHYGEDSLKDVSKNSRCGDSLLSHQSFGIMIEVKNAVLPTPEGRAKFRRDIVESAVDGGIYVFLRDTMCEKEGFSHMEPGPVPLVFIYGVARNPDLLKGAVDCVVGLIKLQRSQMEGREEAAQRFASASATIEGILNGPVHKSVLALRGNISSMANNLASLEKYIVTDIATALGIQAQLNPKAPKPSVLRKTSCGPEPVLTGRGKKRPAR